MSDADDLLALHEEFPEGFPEDFNFTATELVEGCLFVEGALPGSFSVIDNNRQYVIPDQTAVYADESFIGTSVDFTDWTITGVWTIRHNRGLRGEMGDTLNGIPEEELIKYALLFG